MRWTRLTLLVVSAPDLERAQHNALVDLVPIPPVARDLAARFDAAGHRLYLVGGSVRDALLGRPVSWAGESGTGAGIDDTGALLVRLAGGGLHTLAAGEVHLGGGLSFGVL